MQNAIRRETAKYVQLAGVLRQAIAQRRWEIGDQLPTVEELSKEHEVSRITVRHAMNILENEQLITRTRGRGTHVTQVPAAMRKLTLSTSWADFRRTDGGHGRSRVLSAKDATDMPAPLPSEGLLSRRYQHLIILGTHKNGIPISIRDTYLDWRVYQKLRGKIKDHSMIDLLSEYVSTMTILNEIESASALVAARLKVHAGSPVLKGRHLGLDAQNKIVFLDFSFLRGDYVKFEINVA